MGKKKIILFRCFKNRDSYANAASSFRKLSGNEVFGWVGRNICPVIRDFEIRKK